VEINKSDYLDYVGRSLVTGQYVYPVEQFVDGRPAKGIAAINALIPNPRVA
jgi:hypothetical protein